MQYGSPPRYFVGLDLVQGQDYTALAVIERQGISNDAQLALRHLYRFSLGTSYPTIVAEVSKLLSRPPLSQPDTELAIDETGVGTAVVELFQRAGLRAMVRPIHITGGATVNKEGSIWYIPKRELVGTIQVALQTGRLKIASNLPEASNLVRELQDFRVTITEAANDTYGGRQGTHDDLVLAVAMALWVAEHNYMPLMVLEY